MKIEYDKETDTLTITLREARVKESDGASRRDRGLWL
ncbi:MAG TPA: DUF2283 domain-containing protein [Pyrinomonadaceae bacterium]|nr:DUF2283 domain-containing protein [Pyrinomonadaceae bacterium]